MAGKISGASGNNFGQHSGSKVIPSAMWEVQHQPAPESAGAAFAGAMLKKEYDKSKGTGLKVP